MIEVNYQDVAKHLALSIGQKEVQIAELIAKNEALITKINELEIEKTEEGDEKDESKSNKH